MLCTVVPTAISRKPPSRNSLVGYMRLRLAIGLRKLTHWTTRLSAPGAMPLRTKTKMPLVDTAVLTTPVLDTGVMSLQRLMMVLMPPPAAGLHGLRHVLAMASILPQWALRHLQVHLECPATLLWVPAERCIASRLSVRLVHNPPFASQRSPGHSMVHRPLHGRRLTQVIR